MLEKILKKKQIIFAIIYLITFYYAIFPGKITIIEKSKGCNFSKPVAWSDTPSLTLMTRLYAGGVMEYYNTFLVSYLLFWPWKYWKNSDLAVIFDAESEEDHRLATVLGNLPPYPNVHFEDKPDAKTFCSNWRREGYSRQQFSNFYSELYTDKDYIGIIDSDTVFSTVVTPEDLFVNGKPRIFGYNGCCAYGFHKSLTEVIGGEVIGEFMVNTVFPIIIKREHFQSIREHITKRMKKKTFPEAFHEICTKYNYYSQFDIIIHYLWNFKREEYSWHLKDALDVGFHKLKERMTENEAVKAKYDPIVNVANMVDHVKYPTNTFRYFSSILCDESNMVAGSCSLYKDSMSEWRSAQQTDAFKLENGDRPEQFEKPWSTKKKSWHDAVQKHKDNIFERYKNATPSFIPHHSSIKFNS